MSLVIQKYGGSSLASARHVLRCARNVVEARRTGSEVVVVVSAMGNATDQLLALASEINASPDRRSLDLLLASGEQVSTAAMGLAINAIGSRFGCYAATLNVQEAGILTDGDHCEAQIERIDTGRIESELDDGHIVVVPGFLGITPMKHVATLGRGGSDITAVGLAAALRNRDPALRCEIFTDVDGVFTADPCIVPQARALDELTYDDMIELATSGARVLHPRSALLAQQSNVAIEIKLSPSHVNDEVESSLRGTRIAHQSAALESQRVVGCTLQTDLTQLVIALGDSSPAFVWDLQQSIIEQVRPVDVSTPLSEPSRNLGTLVVTLASEHARIAEQVVERVLHNQPGTSMTRRDPVAAMTVVGRCMLGEPRVLATLREAIGHCQATIHASSLSDRRIVMVTDNQGGNRLLAAVHSAMLANGLIASSSAPHPDCREASAPTSVPMVQSN